MKLLQLRYFCTIAECENVSRAAEKLMVAQPALSKTLISLEKELNTQLFDRTGKYLQLNDAGQLFYHQVKRALLLIDQAAEEIRDASYQKEKSIVICIETLQQFMPALISEFHRQYPEIPISLNSSNARACVADGNFDIFLYADTADPVYNIIKKPLFSEEFILIVPKACSLAGRTEINLKEAKSYPFIFTCSVNSNLEKLYRSLCHLAGFQPDIQVNGCRLENTGILVSEGSGVSIIPSTAWYHLNPDLKKTIVPLKISYPKYQRQFFIAWSSEHVLSVSAKKFIDFSEEYFRRLFPSGNSSVR